MVRVNVITRTAKRGNIRKGIIFWK